MPPIRSPRVAYEVVDGQAILLTADGGHLVTLNALGTAVWNLLDGVREAQALAETISGQFEHVPVDVIVTDITTFLADLAADDLVIDDSVP